MALLTKEPQSHDTGGKRKATLKHFHRFLKRRKGPLLICMSTNAQPPFKGRRIPKITSRLIIRRNSFPAKPVAMNLGA